MSWSAKVNGNFIDITASSKGELLRLLKSARVIDRYWFEKKRRPIAMWVSKDIVELIDHGDYRGQDTRNSSNKPSTK